MTQQWEAQKWDWYEVSTWLVWVLTEFMFFHSNVKVEDSFIFYSQLMKHHQVITVQVLWHVTIQPLGGERPFYLILGGLLDLDCGIPDAGAVSRVATTPHRYPYIPSLLRYIPHSPHSKEGLEDGLRSWCHLCHYQILPLLKEEVDEPLCRTWAIYWEQLLWSTDELQILQQGCGAQEGSWRHTKKSVREAIP